MLIPTSLTMSISSWAFLIFIHTVQVEGVVWGAYPFPLGWNECEAVGLVDWSGWEKQTWRCATFSSEPHPFILKSSAPKWLDSTVSQNWKTNLVRVKTNERSYYPVLGEPPDSVLLSDGQTLCPWTNWKPHKQTDNQICVSDDVNYRVLWARFLSEESC